MAITNCAKHACMDHENCRIATEAWSTQVRCALERIAADARAALPSVQTEVDADVDNFGDAP
jgi:hypothetical protein